MNNETNNPSSRKKFLVLGLGAVAFFSLFKFSLPSNKKTKMVKMLTQDGKLVEVSEDLLKGKKEKIKDKEIFNWIKNKNSKPKNN